MYAHKDPTGRVTTDFLNGAEIFMYQVKCYVPVVNARIPSFLKVKQFGKI